MAADRSGGLSSPDVTRAERRRPGPDPTSLWVRTTGRDARGRAFGREHRNNPRPRGPGHGRRTLVGPVRVTGPSGPAGPVRVVRTKNVGVERRLTPNTQRSIP